MDQLPRFSRSLRASLRLDIQRNANYQADQVVVNLWHEENERAKTISWKKFKMMVQQKFADDTNKLNNVTKQLQNLWNLTRNLIGDDENAAVIDDSAIFLFRFFLDVSIVMVRHLSELKVIFGKITSQHANKICSMVCDLKAVLSDDLLQVIRDEVKHEENGKDEDGKKATKRWGNNIKIQLPNGVETDADESIEMLQNFDVTEADDEKDGSAVSASFSMRYDDIKPAAQPKTTFNRAWLLMHVSNEVVESLLSVLKSKKSNNELQNELIELLGFDKFEILENILEHRKEIIKNIENDDKVNMMYERAAAAEQCGVANRTKSQPVVSSQVVVQSEQELSLLKKVRKDEKKLRTIFTAQKTAIENELDDNDDGSYDYVASRLKLQQQQHILDTIKNQPILPKAKKTSDAMSWLTQSSRKVTYPYVFDSQMEARTHVGFVAGSKLVLPESALRTDNKMYEEINLPANTAAVDLKVGDQRIQIADLDEIGQLAFKGVKELNRIQSVVFEKAYHSNDNLLICAPTGAGKTNVAMLTIINAIRSHTDQGVIHRDQFKVVYVAPMKALAAEMVENFGKRLKSLGISVRELTGDMSLTKSEIQQTQMLVTTPEKWDVITRKGAGDVALISLVKLLIIDEVHLLHGERGPVVEALVARTLRLVESTQNMIRIVGLSATLPNYIDVARFLRVNPMVGLFYFDGRFRPVPLEQTFVGVKNIKPMQQLADMDTVCYEKCVEQLKLGYQVMVFVHARNATVRTANVLREMATQKQHLTLFAPDESKDLGLAKRSMANSRNKQLNELFQYGIAMHHAGMLRTDRSMVERYFGEGLIKVLVCTATLAWGVNLPAHAVIIKGTEIYDAKHGAFVDIGILDVLQIFGRAGRPQYEKSGLGIIITAHNKLTHYLSLLTNQFPIESNFIECLADNLNAEITLGTICNIDEAIEWLSYTYLFVRMRLNPQVYGMTYEDIMEDPTLEHKRRALIITAAQSLDKAQMIRYNVRTGDLHATDLGRTASHFYIKYATVEIFNEHLMDVMSEPEILHMMSLAQEFQQLKVRDEELDELEDLTNDYCEVVAKGGAANIHGKVNILMQTYLSRGQVRSFSLVSDLSYITQNAVRIVRALFTIELHRNNALLAGRLLMLSKMFERQMWDFHTPLRQFTRIGFDMIEKIEDRGISVMALRDMDAKEIGDYLRNQRNGAFIGKCAAEFPIIEIDATLHPITRTVLRIRIFIRAKFRWNDGVHGKFAEPFWIWIEDPESNYIYHSEYFQLTRKQAFSDEPQELVVTIPLREPLPPQYYIRAISDRWLGSETYFALSFQHLILPELHPPHTELLPLQPLPVSVLNNKNYESLYPFTHFNPIQTQIFHCLYHNDTNVLLGAPTGSGKTIAAEMAIFRVFNTYPNGKVVYIAPLKALVRERIEDWKYRLEQRLGKKVVELTGDVTPDARAIRDSHVIVTTPEKWDGISRSWQTREYVKDVALIVIDEIHLLGEDRGPVLEVIVSRTNFIASHTKRTLRIVGLSTALANARDLANWLGIKDMGLYNFKPSVRPVPLSVHISGFPGKHYCPRMATMNRPAYQAIRQYSPCTPALIFVSSRRQTRLTALDLIAFLAGEDNPKQFMHLPEHEMDQILENIKDSNLKLTLAFGIGLHHAGLHEHDRKTVEELFLHRKIQILVATATLAWGINLPAHLVIIKGTEYYDPKLKRYVDMPITDVLQMMGRAGRPQFGNEGIAVVLVHDVKKNFYKKFLYDPFPVESHLLNVLPDHVNAEIVAGTVQTKQSILDYFTWTYCFRRLMRNPTYYDLASIESQDVNRFLSNLIETVLQTLTDAGCIEIDSEDSRHVYSTSMGRISSYYYLSHQSMRHFADCLHNDMTFENVLWAMSNAYEFYSQPCRHNEDKYNIELSKNCRLSVDPLTCDSPHTKTFLLIQAHFSHLPLPNSDYLTDTKSVLDQSIRILQAMIDICAENGWLISVIRIQQLMQCIIQGRWFDESPVLSLPYVEEENIPCFKRIHLKESILTLPTLKENIFKNYEILAGPLREDFEETQIERIYQVLCDMPTLDIDLCVIGQLHNETDVVQNVKVPMTRDDWIQIHQNEEYTIQANFHRYVHRSGKERHKTNSIIPKVHCPKFSKIKDEGWFLILGEPGQAELIALKRCSYRNSKSIHSVTFIAPDKIGRYLYTVYIISDSYIGFDQQYDLQFEVINEKKHDHHQFMELDFPKIV